MVNRGVRWAIIGGLCAILVVGLCVFLRPSTRALLLKLPVVSPPSQDYRDAVVRSFKMNHVTDLTFRYIGQVDNTDSACFYTFLNDGKLYYDEAFLSDDPSISPAHQWTVVYGGHNPVRMNWRQPITRIAESGQTPSGKSYVLEGGFINNPSINDIEYTFADGAIQDIPVTHGQKLYTLFKVSANTKDVGVLRIQAYHRTPIKLE